VHDNLNGRQADEKIGLFMNEAWWGLRNLTFNYLHYLQRQEAGFIAA
jgi:hypothetical protein